MSSAVVNKAVLASWLGVSLTTLAAWMLRYGAEFPMIERGANGREYKFDPAAVAAFLRTKQEEQIASKAERDEQLSQLKLPFDLPGVEAPPKASSPKEELLAWELRKRQRLEAEAARKLLPAAAVEGALASVLARVSRDAHAFLRQLGREEAWPEARILGIERRFGEQQRATVAALMSQFGFDDEATRAAR